MKRNCGLHVLRVLAIVVVAVTVAGFLVMHLWNWLMPTIFGVHTVTFLQALGLFVLAKVLLGGFHGRGGKPRWGRQMRERWGQMTPEEQERFRAGMRGRHGCRWGGGVPEGAETVGTEG